MSVGAICTREVHTVSHAMTVWDAARTMLEHHVGTLIVTDRAGRALGILTDRDIVLRCVAKEFNPDDLSVTDIMSTPLRTLPVDAEVREALHLMADGEMRRIVIIGDDGSLFGVLTLDDVLAHVVEEGQWLGGLLRTQVPV